MSKSVQVLNFSQYIRPDIIENKHKGYVLNGQDHSFYQYLIDRKNGSPTNSAILNTYNQLVYGKGLSVKGSIELTDKINKIIKPKDLRRIVSDFVDFGEASMQIVSKKSRVLGEIAHVPINKIAPSIETEDGVIESFWFSKDWTDVNRNEPEEIPSFGGGNPLEIYGIKPYSSGKNYFSDPEYMACLPYCEAEEEISNLNLNSIKNGLSAGYIINVPNGGSMSDEEKDEFTGDVRRNLTGSSATSRIIFAFNGADKEISITQTPVNENVHKQWEFLTQEARQQIITGHRLTSPSLAGLSMASGFSSTADEMDMAEGQLMKRVISPKQNYILEALEEILGFHGIDVELEFLPLTEVKEEVKEESKGFGFKLSEEDTQLPTGALADDLIKMGEDLTESDWTLLGHSDVDYATDDDIYDLIQLTSTGTARPNSKSEQDSEDIVIRYRYVGNPNPEREFCKKMIKANKLYRKEDIIEMGRETVNEGFGYVAGGDTPNTPYSIWLYKGGGKLSDKYPNGTCKHKWQREIYLKKSSSVDVNSPLAKTISTSEARRRGYKVPTNESDASIEPHRNK